MIPEIPPFQPGDVVAEKYEILRELGAGSFAHVYLARHTLVASLHVAIKVLRAEHLEDSDVIKRFHREAEAAASLRSRHTIRVSDFGETEEGEPFLVMEYVEGMSLREALRRRPLGTWEVHRYGVQILRALEEAHKAGIVHRDLKPDNVLLTKEPGEDNAIARVVDFGIAKILDSAKPNFANAEATAAGVLMCTPHYASPELLRGAPTPQSDLYALGMTLIQLLDRRLPYREREFYAVAARQMSTMEVPLGPIAAHVPYADVLKRAVAKDVEHRWRTATEMRHALEAFQAEPIRLASPAVASAVSRRTDGRIARTVAGPADAASLDEALDAIERDVIAAHGVSGEAESEDATEGHLVSDPDGHADTEPPIVALDAEPSDADAGEAPAVPDDTSPPTREPAERDKRLVWIPWVLVVLVLGAWAIASPCGGDPGDERSMAATNPPSSPLDPTPADAPSPVDDEAGAAGANVDPRPSNAEEVQVVHPDAQEATLAAATEAAVVTSQLRARALDTIESTLAARAEAERREREREARRDPRPSTPDDETEPSDESTTDEASNPFGGIRTMGGQ